MLWKHSNTTAKIVKRSYGKNLSTSYIEYRISYHIKPLYIIFYGINEYIEEVYDDKNKYLFLIVVFKNRNALEKKS